MGKIKIMFPTDSVTLGNWVSELTPLSGENKGGFLFLKTKALVRWVEDFFVVFTWNNRCLRKAGQDLAALGQFFCTFLDVDRINHPSFRCGSIRILIFSSACFASGERLTKFLISSRS